MKCFYHTDMDGKCAAAIVRRAWRDREADGIGESYIPIDYKDEFPFDSVAKDEEVVIVDFSLQKDGDFEKLLEITPNVIWIDHHKSAIEKHAHISKMVHGIQREDPTGGCGLTWQFFFSGEKAPIAVKLIGDYDTWTFEYGDRSRLFQLGCQLHDTSPESGVWDWWLEWTYGCATEVADGQVIKRYQDKANAAAVAKWSFFAEFEGYKAICCNSTIRSSTLFDSVTAPYDLLMPFTYDGQKWTVSVFTEREDIDCSKLAEKHGGGGHPGAAGFVCEVLPFVPNKTRRDT